MSIVLGNAMRLPLASNCVQTCVTSPPYFGLRDYNILGQLGLEETPELYVKSIVSSLREVGRVLKPNGTLWLNIGDSYAGSGRGLMGNGVPSDRKGAKQGTVRGCTVGKFPAVSTPNHKPKDLIGIPWLLAFALQAEGWRLRSDVIWAKTNPFPESVRDRPTSSHEYLFLLSKEKRYYFNREAIQETRASGEGKRNSRDVWLIPTESFPGAHFATMPTKLVEPCIKAGSEKGDLVLDPFVGSGTVGLVARRLERRFIGVDLNSEYCCMAKKRIANG